MATDVASLSDAPASAARPFGRRALRVLSHLALLFLPISAGYLFIANRASGPPRIELSAFAYTGMLLLHLGLGLGSVLLTLVQARAFFRSVREQKGVVALFGNLMGLSLALTLLTGVAFLGFGFQWLPLRLRPVLRLLHDASTGAFLFTGLLYLLLRARTGQSKDAPERRQARHIARIVFALGLPFVLLLAYTLYAPNTDRKIKNPELPPMTAFDEGGGVHGKFFPASVTTVGDRFFPPEYYTDSKSCGVAGCHPDLYKQWSESAHRFSSFNNQWYRKAIEYMQETVGTKTSKWCGGCHDMAVLQTEDPKNPGKSRFDRPIKTQVWPPEENPTSHAGIGCAACHSVVSVKSTMGVSDFLADYPPMHKYLDTKNPLLKGMHNFLTRLAPEPHKKTFLRPFHKDETAKFCSSCHKVHLDQAVNDYRWIRGQNEYDAWQGSGVSGFGAASFYYPVNEKTGQPDFKKCADCHMPKVASEDAGNKGGFVKSHRFPGANTALPHVYHLPDQLKETVKFLQDGALTIDIFGIRRPKAGAKPLAQIAQQRPAAGDTGPQAFSTSGDPNATTIVASTGPVLEETLTAPLNRGGQGAVLVRGESPLIEVVVRTKKLGHAFPGGTIDAFDCWVELEAKDENGKVFFHSGKLQWPDGPVEEGAEKYRAVLLDGKGRRIDRRNVWAIRAVAYVKTLGSGSADVVHYRLKVPKDIGNKVTLTAKLNYRKFDWFNNYWAFAGRTETEPSPSQASLAYKAGKTGNPYVSDDKVPVALGLGKKEGRVAHGYDDRAIFMDADLTKVSANPISDVPALPITVLCSNTITLPVVNPGAPMTAPTTPGDEKVDRVRWNDYGIGLLLQGDLRNATNAFTRATEVSPKWPEGYVNIGRVRQVERDTPAAIAAFQKAFALYDAAPTPMTRYQKARTQNFYAQALFDQGKIEEALSEAAKVREVFPDDRNVRNLSGIWLFRVGRYDEAILHFKHALSIEPEDITAHYNLMKCYRAKGDMKTASTHEKLYKRFKADEASTRLSGIYRRNNPADNNLAQPIHEIGDAIIRPKPEWLKKREAARVIRAMKSSPAMRRAGLVPEQMRVVRQ
jgi:tetratricopeptide (TPR) repeat protein